MNIAIYHGFPFIHFEMLGYIIDYLNLLKINYDTYAYSDEDYDISHEEWYKYYLQKDKIKDNFIKLQTQESKVINELENKYGKGTISLETGEFISNS